MIPFTLTSVLASFLSYFIFLSIRIGYLRISSVIKLIFKMGKKICP